MNDSFVFTADLHLRQTIWSGFPTLAGDTYCSFRQIVDYCIGNGQNLVLGGDTFDVDTPESQDVLFFQSQVRRMREVGLEVFAIDGNHDDADPSWCCLVEGVTHVDGKVFRPSTTSVAYGMSYRAADKLQEDLANVPAECNTLVLHQTGRWAMDIPGRWSMDPAWTPPYIGLVLLGDYHVAMEWEDPVTGTLHVSPGPAAIQKIDEGPATSFVVVGKDLKITRVPLVTRKQACVTLLSEKDLEQFVAAVPGVLEQASQGAAFPEIAKPILRVRFASNLPAAYERIVAAVADKAFLWRPEIVDTGVAFQIEKKPEASTREAVLASLVDPKSRPEAYEFIVNLLNRDVQSVLEETRSRIGVQRPGISPVKAA